MYCIYKHTNKINGKCYIGQTKKRPKIRWGKNGYNYKYCSHFYSAIQKYGWSNFNHEILEKDIPTLELANEREQYWIKYFNSFYQGYNSTLGGNSNLGLGIAVLQIDKDTLEVVEKFESIGNASEKMKIPKHNIINCCKRRQVTAGNYCWCYEKDYTSNWQKPNIRSKQRTIVCVETGEIFKSAVEAAKAMKIESSVSGITTCCKHRALTCKGYHWCYYEEYKNFSTRYTLRKKRVICIETLEIFPSIASAGKKYGVDPSCIKEACTGEIRKSCNLHWQFLEDYIGDYKERPRKYEKRKVNTMKIKIKKINENATIPFQAKTGDFCYDVIAISEEEIAPNIWKYGLGFAYEIVRKDKDTTKNKLKKILEDPELKISIDFRPRSSIWKTGMILSNCCGTLDEFYRGEVGAIFYHIMPTMPRYKIGDKIGQIKLGFTVPIEFIEVQEINTNTERGTDGFGSTGK